MQMVDDLFGLDPYLEWLSLKSNNNSIWLINVRCPFRSWLCFCTDIFVLVDDIFRGIFFNRCQDDIDTKSVSRCFMVVYHCGVSVRITNGCEMNGKVKAISPIKWIEMAHPALALACMCALARYLVILNYCRPLSLYIIDSKLMDHNKSLFIFSEFCHIYFFCSVFVYRSLFLCHLLYCFRYKLIAFNA